MRYRLSNAIPKLWLIFVQRSSFIIQFILRRILLPLFPFGWSGPFSCMSFEITENEQISYFITWNTNNSLYIWFALVFDHVREKNGLIMAIAQTEHPFKWIEWRLTLVRQLVLYKKWWIELVGSKFSIQQFFFPTTFRLSNFWKQSHLTWQQTSERINRKMI